MSRSRAFCFTWNNYATNFADCLHALYDNDNLRYLCYQEEVGESGTPHIQGYLYCGSVKTIAQIVSSFLTHCACHPHVEIAKGSPQQNKEYCSKAATPPCEAKNFTEIGMLPQRGKSATLQAICDDIVSKKRSISEIASSDPLLYVNHYKGLLALQATTVPGRSPAQPVEVHWFYGPTGTGKSRKAFDDHPDAYVKMASNTWWDHYTGQTTVIIDDYRVTMCSFDYLLRLLDRYPMLVEIKGGTVKMNATRFIVTAPQQPEVMWCLKTPEAIDQLLRRITTITHVTLSPTGETVLTVLKDSATAYSPNFDEMQSCVTTFNLRKNK